MQRFIPGAKVGWIENFGSPDFLFDFGPPEILPGAEERTNISTTLKQLKTVSLTIMIPHNHCGFHDQSFLTVYRFWKIEIINQMPWNGQKTNWSIISIFLLLQNYIERRNKILEKQIKLRKNYKNTLQWNEIWKS